jgi:3-oxoacyl-[acyl-carrier-protein] synthase-3
VPLALRTDPPAAGSVLLSVAASRPDTAVPADRLGAPFGKDGAWVRQRTGIEELRRLDGQSLHKHAVAAGRLAMDRAGVADVDLVVGASCSANRSPAASLARAVAAELQPRAAHLDLNAACSGFCYALGAADTLVRSGAAHRVLVVAAEGMSELLDPADLGTSIIFGDGAGAAVVAADPAGTGIGPLVCGADGSGAPLIRTERHVLRMRGQDVFRWAVDSVPAMARAACARAGVALDDVDVFVPHQANLRIIDAVTKRLGFAPRVRVATDVVASGNTSAASIPLALARLYDSGARLSGSLALLVGFGAGLTWAAQVVRLP